MGVRYRLVGGPLDGQIVDPPPDVFNKTAETTVAALGKDPRAMGVPYLTHDGWVYEFAPDQPDVMIGREQTEQEQSETNFMAAFLSKGDIGMFEMPGRPSRFGMPQDED